ncbi:MAG: hypothetical protein EP149_09630 [Phascolarctobacterium sp.]|nr:hypothetical protein [Phascolarctobacterium sp.]MUU07903.1 hypothetical protein [Phascolarctobacterium sp.]MUU17546.1 hypothetical protein [Phascolarctobacterium sp.]
MELLDIDYEILNFIDQFEKVTESNILKKFPNDKYATKYRLKLLSTPRYTNPIAINRSVQGGTLTEVRQEIIPDTSYIEYKKFVEKSGGMTLTIETEFVFVTPLGRMALQNQSVQKCTKSKALREFRFWKIVPILISVIALLVAILAYNKSQSTEQYVKIEISKEVIDTISGNHSSNGNSAKN